jgi:hypothetical protein
LNRATLFVVIVFVFGCGVKAPSDKNEVTKGALMGIYNSCYWGELSKEVCEEVFRSTTLRPKVYATLVKDLNKYGYTCVLETPKINGNTLAIEIWPLTKTKNTVYITQERIPEKRSGKSIDVDLQFSANWRTIASSFDGEYTIVASSFMRFVKQYAKKRGLISTQHIYIGPFNKWSECVYFYWKERKSVYKVPAAWFYLFDCDPVSFDTYATLIWEETKYNLDSIQVRNCMRDGRLLEI